MAGASAGGIAIVGGGFTGAAVAYHLARLLPCDEPVRVVEPRPTLGGGVAYSTEDPSHRINVPAARMTLVPDDAEHFSRWLAASGELDHDPDAVWTATGAAFPQRAVFGRYVAEALAPSIADGRVQHLRDRASAASIEAGAWVIELENGGRLSADVLVLATTHPLPATPPQLTAIAAESGYVADPYATGVLDRVSLDARILIVGSGLTAADVVATLDRRGHRGIILGLSRNGLRSRGHAEVRGEWRADFEAPTRSSARSLLRAVRAEVETAAREGAPWQWVLDRVREDGGAIWQSLSEAERQRVVRRLRTFWDVHRFRVAPQVEAVLDRRTAEGTFAHLAARLVSSRATTDGLAVGFRRRGENGVEERVVDVVVNTTGPSHRGVLSGHGLLPTLASAGRLRPDAVGLGLDTDRQGRAIGTDGRAADALFVAGPLARGTFGELMGLNEVSRYALFIAERVAAEAASSRLPRLA